MNSLVCHRDFFFFIPPPALWVTVVLVCVLCSLYVFTPIMFFFLFNSALKQFVYLALFVLTPSLCSFILKPTGMPHC